MMGRTPTGQTRERILEFMRQRLSSGQPPTVRDVQRAFGFRSVQSARSHLEALVTSGHLAKLPGQARGYRLTNQPVRAPDQGPSPSSTNRLHWIPILGRVTAGGLALAVEDLEGHLPVPADRFRTATELFALRVRGDSMRDAGILAGDIVLVRRQDNADEGTIVVALVDEEATVKRLRYRADRIELHPANPDYPVLVPDPKTLRILGRVVEIRRYLD
ncbi:transcriptional repressor LexA [Thioalkalicoccus limnaeus]|uniref:Transcriptional repressor LexA n=1 Tax=Thioalkalicoccus limnaeus TaxID=120681 RepID=A0ABV4BBI8_9GAMM